METEESPMPTIVLAPDKFKGSMTAAQVCDHISAGMLDRDSTLQIVPRPVADGGEGTVAAALSRGAVAHEVEVVGPLGSSVHAVFAALGDTAVIEMSAASGLDLVRADQRDAMRADSAGTGQLISAALDQGCTRIVLGVGGSASTDGGAGMLRSLGARILDDAGEDVEPGGAGVLRAAGLDLTDLDPRLETTPITLATDVDSPLTGPTGAAAIFGPQKGADLDQVRHLDAALTRWAAVVGASTASRRGASVQADHPGAGAAGGVGFAALAVLGASLRHGIDVVLDLIDFDSALEHAALVVTGEGSLDQQTLSGKAPVGVAQRAGAAGVPVVAVAGQNHLTAQESASAGFADVIALTDIEPDVDRCLAEPGPVLRRVGGAIATWLEQRALG